MIDLARFDLESWKRDWSRPAPFSRLVVDDFLEESAFRPLREAALAEPLFFQSDEIFQHKASVEPPQHPLLRSFGDALLGPPFLHALQAMSGLTHTRVSMRAYRYDRGDYLLPHTDFRRGEQAIAFAYYLGVMSENGEPFSGGALQLYDCAERGGELLRTTPGELIEARENRIAFFAVSSAALHRVHEVKLGSRLSLAGWFLP